MFSLARYGPLWPCSLWGRSRARVLDVLPRHFLADFKDSAHSEAPQMGHREPLRVRGAKGTAVIQTQPRLIAASRPAPAAAGRVRPCPGTAVRLRRGRSTQPG